MNGVLRLIDERPPRLRGGRSANKIKPQPSEPSEAIMQRFFTSILPANGRYALVTIVEGKPHHYWCDSREGLVALASRVYNADVYFACSAYDMPADGHPKRRKENVRAVKALWIDLDIKGTTYESLQEALTHASAFNSHCNLPIPTIVFTGGGFHLYWTLPSELTAKEWLVYATGLHNAAHEFGLQVDVKRTRDSASILRVPGHRNLKYANTQPTVRVLNHTSGPLTEDNLALLRSKAGTVHTKAPAQRSSAASSMLPPQTNDADADVIAASCPQIAHFKETGSDSEPHWYACANILKYCANGLERWLEWSSKYDGYSEEQARAKFSHAINSNSGPTLCSSFNSCKTGVCTKCNQPRSVTTPLNAIPSRTAPPVRDGVQTEPTSSGIVGDDDSGEIGYNLPEELQQFPIINGQIHARTNSKTLGAMAIPIVNCDVRFACRITAEDGSGNALVLLVKDKCETRYRDIVIPASTLYGQGATAELARHGIFVHEPALWRSYMGACIDHMDSQGVAAKAYCSFGWQEDDSFIMGPWKYTDKGRSPAILMPELKERAKRIGTVPNGSVKGALRAVNRTMAQMSSGQILAFMVALGAPLVRFTDIEEGGLAAWDFSHESGTGKSTLISLIESCIGKPGCTRISERDTSNATARIFAIMRSLPITLDDPTVGDGSNIRRMVDLAVTGTDKASLDQSRTLRTGASHWRTTFIAASNFNPFDYIDSQRKRRIVGFHEPVKPHLNRTVWPEIAAELRRNGGWIMHALLKDRYLKPEWQEHAIALMRDYKRQLDTKFQFRPEDRFNAWAIAIAITVGDMLRGLSAEYGDQIVFDTAQMVIAGVTAAKDSMQAADNNDGGRASDILGDFIASHMGNMATIYASDARGVLPKVDWVDKGQELVVIYHHKTREYVVRRSKFNAWVKSMGRSHTEVLRELMHTQHLVKDNAYVDMNLPGKVGLGTQRCYVFRRALT